MNAVLLTLALLGHPTKAAGIAKDAEIADLKARLSDIKERATVPE